MVVAGDKVGGVDRELLSNGSRTSVWKNGEILEIDCGDGSQSCECT